MSIGIKNLVPIVGAPISTMTTLAHEQILHYGLDAVFLGRKVTAALDREEYPCQASTYWEYDDIIPYSGSAYPGKLILPGDLMGVAAYSASALRYPYLTVKCILPDLAFVGNENAIFMYVGLENGASLGNALASFRLTKSGTSTTLSVYLGNMSTSALININNKKPVDYSTAEHVYCVRLHKNLLIFLIDENIACLAVPTGKNSVIKVAENVNPYSLVLCPEMPSSLQTLVEFAANNRTAAAPGNLEWPLSPLKFRATEGAEVPVLNLPLYLQNSSTLLAGYTINVGNVTSHPFPVSGFSGKSVYFLADTAGTLELQTYTASGNWRAYDSLSVAANTPLFYSITGEAVLMRLVYTPSSYPAIINEAEVTLR